MIIFDYRENWDNTGCRTRVITRAMTVCLQVWTLWHLSRQSYHKFAHSKLFYIYTCQHTWNCQGSGCGLSGHGRLLNRESKISSHGIKEGCNIYILKINRNDLHTYTPKGGTLCQGTVAANMTCASFHASGQIWTEWGQMNHWGSEHPEPEVKSSQICQVCQAPF